MRSRSLIHPGPVAGRASPLPVFAKSFRPFFWLGAAYAVAIVPLWLVALAGRFDLGSYFGGSFWHAHEMIFGFTVAVIAGFLMTAVENWTERETARGWGLGVLAAVWFLGRIALFATSKLPKGLVATLDLSFIPLVALVCARPIVAARARRNYVFLGMLFALFGANATMHAGALGFGPALAQKGARIAVDIVILMTVVITARVIPMFTRNATRRDDIRSNPFFDRASMLAMLLVLLGDVFGLDESMMAMIALATSALVTARAWSWGTRHTLRDPLLWVLHAGHAWIAIGLALRGIAWFVPRIGPTLALHALTAGAIGMLTMGMMARVSLGHTGRMLAAPRGMSIAFASILASAVVRVFGPLFGAGAYLPSMMIAGSLFTLGFAIYLARYTSILFAPRVDGRPG